MRIVTNPSLRRHQGDHHGPKLVCNYCKLPGGILILLLRGPGTQLLSRSLTPALDLAHHHSISPELRNEKLRISVIPLHIINFVFLMINKTCLINEFLTPQTRVSSHSITALTEHSYTNGLV